MLGSLTEKMQGLLSSLSRQKKLTEENINDAVRTVRLALLDADVNFSALKGFIKRVKEKALGDEVLKAVKPGDQFIKIVHDELVALMGGSEQILSFSKKPSSVLMCGLQGSGKTTHTVKVALALKKEGVIKNPLVVACDLARPAAIEQLKTLAGKGGISFFSLDAAKDPLQVSKEAKDYAIASGHDLVIYDTAGRLHIDETLMDELQGMKSLLLPEHIWFVASATIGQEAANIAKEFHEKVGMTGVILTMLDGNTRGGAAISIKEVTGCPLLYEGIGESIGDIQKFNPSSMADRILGMGDTINLVRKMQEHIDQDEAKKLEEKIKKASFTYTDFLGQIRSVKKMGSIKNLLGMLPGASSLSGMNIDDKEVGKIEAMILSMTTKERMEHDELTIPRRHRVARGSGTTIQDVNKLVKSFKQAKQFFKNMPNMNKMQQLMGGSLWR